MALHDLKKQLKAHQKTLGTLQEVHGENEGNPYTALLRADLQKILKKFKAAVAKLQKMLNTPVGDVDDTQLENMKELSDSIDELATQGKDTHGYMKPLIKLNTADAQGPKKRPKSNAGNVKAKKAGGLSLFSASVFSSACSMQICSAMVCAR